MSVKRIACTLGVHRQQITGAERKRRDGSGKYWQSGAFDALQEAGIARIETQGSGRNLSYLISVLHSLPLLTPTQVETLDPILQEQHAKWLRRADLEQKEWIQLKLPTLVQ